MLPPILRSQPPAEGFIYLPSRGCSNQCLGPNILVKNKNTLVYRSGSVL